MENITRDLLRVSRKAQTCVGAIIKKYDLTIAEQPFFMAIKANDGLTQEDITTLVGVDKAMTTRVIKSLEGKGLVRKEQDLVDKRQNHIFRTDALVEMTDKVLPELLSFNEVLAKGISNEEFELFKDILNRMEENISGFNEGEV